MTTTDKPVRVSGQKCRTYVTERKPFHNSNKQLYGEWTRPNLYVVYSYGPHWPLFAYCTDTNTWYANWEKASRTTSKHYSQANPYTSTAQPKPEHRSCAWMKGLVYRGFAHIVLTTPTTDGDE
jgi:hypothetical protein